MAVYVDRGIAWVPSKQWPYPYVYHMYADKAEDLHKFAVEVLGLKRKWCSDFTQPHSKLLHYDLSPGKYKEARAKGAKLDDRGLFKGLILSPKKRGAKKGSKKKSKMDRS